MHRKSLSDPFMTPDPRCLVLPRWFYLKLRRLMLVFLKQRRIYGQPFLLGADFSHFKSWQDHVGRWVDGSARLAIDDLSICFLSHFVLCYPKIHETVQRFRTKGDIDQADRYIAKAAKNFIHRLQSKADGLGAFIYKIVQGAVRELRKGGVELHPSTAISIEKEIDILADALQRNRPKWRFFLKAVYSDRRGQTASRCLAEIVAPLLQQMAITESLLRAATLLILRHVSRNELIDTFTPNDDADDTDSPSGKGNGQDRDDKVHTRSAPLYPLPDGREPSANVDVAPYRQLIKDRDFISLERVVRNDIANAEGITAPTKRKADKLLEVFIEALQRDSPLSHRQGDLATHIGTTPQNFCDLKRKLFGISPFFRLILDPPRPRHRKKHKGTEHGIPIRGDL